MPLGERLGSISPRASYIRSVCGCMSASSAATEIMNTPRSEETSTRVVVVVPDPSRRLAISSSCTLGGLREQLRPRVAVHHLGQLVDRLGLLGRQRRRDVDHEPVVDVAAALAAEPRRPLAAQPLDGAVLGPARNAQALGAVQRRHLDHGAAHRLGNRQRDLDLEVLADALEHRRVRHARDHVQVAGLAAARARLALAGQPDPAAVAHAGGDVDPQPPHAALSAAAAAGRARILDHGARSRGSSSTAGRSRRSPGSATRPRGRCRPGRPSAWCRAWRRCRGRSDTAARSAPQAGPGRR